MAKTNYFRVLAAAVAATLAACLLVLGEPASAQVSTPPDLGDQTNPTGLGESFTAGDIQLAPSNFTVTSRSCNPDGESTITFVASGPAAGPYTGTYREEGSVTIGPQNEGSGVNRFGRVTAAKATFTIDSTSPPARVTGTKSLAFRQDTIGQCDDGAVQPGLNRFQINSQPLRYEARIGTAQGTFSDQGQASFNFAVSTSPDPAFDSRFFQENFFSDNQPPVLVANDSDAPTLTIPADITVDATSPSGAAVTYSESATDNIDQNPTVICTPPTGSTFSIGTTTVNCTATDVSGNSASGSFEVTVKGAPEQQVGDLKGLVTGLNLPAGTDKSLQAKLNDALTALKAGDSATACTALNDFISQVNAQAGKKISASDAQKLIDEANRIKAVLDCP